MNRLFRLWSAAGFLLAVIACAATPVRWERQGLSDSANDEGECRAAAQQAAIQRLPYGDGPPLYGFHSDMSRLQWTQEIDNARYYLARDLTATCMRTKGYQLVPVAGQPPSRGGNA